MFTNFRKKVNYLIKTEKRNYYSNKFTCNITNPKKFWQVTNELLFNKTTNTNLTNITLNINNIKINNQTEVANTFNEFFVNIGNSNNLLIPTQPVINNALTNMNLYKTTPVEIQNIKSLNKKSTYGHDNIPIKFYTLDNEIIAEKISELTNNVLKTGIYPNCMKIAKVTPLYKSGDKQNVSNYRPISVLPIFSKILEKVISVRFEQYLTENQIINENQFGFTTQSSTLAACTQLLNFIELKLDQKQIVGCFFIDIQKAYDSIQIEILLKKLKNIGITHTTLKVFESFHSNRLQYIKFNTTTSEIKNINNGVAQGSMLSTHEFSLFVNDLLNLNLNGKVQMYADDTVVMLAASDINELIAKMQEDIRKIDTWLKENKLQLNTKKTNYIIFNKHKQYNPDRIPTISLDNNIITNVTETKYLGLIIDNKLNWHQHIHKIKNKITPIIFTLFKLKHFLHPKAKLDIYNAHIVSHLQYLNPIWNTANITKLNELKVLQNKAIKTIYGFSQLEPTINLYSLNLKTTSFSKLCITQTLLLIFKIKNKYIKHNFQLTLRSDTHTHYTRQSEHINISLTRTNTGLNTIMSRGIRMCNNLPPTIKNTSGIAQFKHHLQYFINNT